MEMVDAFKMNQTFCESGEIRRFVRTPKYVLFYLIPIFLHKIYPHRISMSQGSLFNWKGMVHFLGYGMFRHAFVTLAGRKILQKIVLPLPYSLFFCLFELNDCLPAGAKRGMAIRSFSAKRAKKREKRKEGATNVYNFLQPKLKSQMCRVLFFVPQNS